MKQRVKIICLSLLFASFTIFCLVKGWPDEPSARTEGAPSEPAPPFSAEIFRQAGVPDETAGQMDPEFMEMIAADLWESGEMDSMRFVSTETKPAAEAPVGLDFTLTVFQSDAFYYLYPAYTFTGDIKPAGEDAFTVQIAEGYSPVEWSGRIWAKDRVLPGWQDGGAIGTTHLTFQSAGFTGSQLGTPDSAILLKACARCEAARREEGGNRLTLTYAHDPVPADITLTLWGNPLFSTAPLGWQAAETFTLPE